MRKHDGGVRHEKLREKAFMNPEVVKAYQKADREYKLFEAKKARKAELKRDEK